MRAMRSWRRLAAMVALAMGGCEGAIDSGPTGERFDPATCEEASVPPATPLLRIPSDHYARIIEELVPGPLGADLVAASRFPETVITAGFSSDAAANTVSTVESNAIEDNAEAMAAVILTRADTAIPALTGCVAAGFTDAQLDACMPAFIDTFGARAYRRPLTAGERTILGDLYTSIAASQGARAGFASVMQLVLQSPALLYRTERGAGLDDRGAVRLTSHEMATRLSFFLRGSLPDETLRTAAERDELRTPDAVTAHAERLVRNDAFLTVLTDFHRDWLHAYAIGRQERRHPLFSMAARDAMQREMRAYVEMVFVGGDGRFGTLMGSTRLPVAPELASIYGVTSADGSPMEVPHRRGILTLASVLAGLSDEERPHPIHRGGFLRTEVLCAPPLFLPAGVDVNAETASTAHLPTARERLAPTTERGDCRGCHTQFNPLGLALENFDHVGAWRETENGQPIDPSGEMSTSYLRGSFSGPEEMLTAVLDSDDARNCYARQFFRFALGRGEVEADRCTLARLERSFSASDGDIRALAVAITTSRPFLVRAPEGSE